jgi:hypothetical protein
MKTKRGFHIFIKSKSELYSKAYINFILGAGAKCIYNVMIMITIIFKTSHSFTNVRYKTLHLHGAFIERTINTNFFGCVEVS